MVLSIFKKSNRLQRSIDLQRNSDCLYLLFAIASGKIIPYSEETSNWGKPTGFFKFFKRDKSICKIEMEDGKCYKLVVPFWLRKYIKPFRLKWTERVGLK